MQKEGLAKHSLEHINNTDLFKYSPYKTLNLEQRKGLEEVIDQLISGGEKSIIVEGGAGTGKSILAIFLFKLMMTDLEDFSFSEFGDDESKLVYKVQQLKQRYPDPKMALVVPMTSFRQTLKNVFGSIHGLAKSMVVGPSKITKSKYDIIIVDEAHRLRKRKNLIGYGAFDQGNLRLGLDKHKGNELAWVEMQAQKRIYFYDRGQSIKPSDVDQQDFEALAKSAHSERIVLKSQFRSKGGSGYVKYIDELLALKVEPRTFFEHKDYEFKLFHSIQNFTEAVKSKNDQWGLCRIVAGYSWKWVSNKEGKPNYDITIEGNNYKWNSEAIDWINSSNSVDEIGCIHTTQGYDLNYTGIIFGNEITYNPETNSIEVVKQNYYDTKGKSGITDPELLKSYILNIYKTIMLIGIRGTYLYVCNPELREYLSQRLVIADESMPSKPEETKPQLNFADDPTAFVNSIPLYDLSVAAGGFSELQSVEDLEWIEAPHDIRLTDDLFACKVVGESMNLIIPNGSICLFRKPKAGSRDGLIVLCEHDSFETSDFVSTYTVKEYSSIKEEIDGSWRHKKILLKPRSKDSKFETLVLEEDDLESFNVRGVFERVLL